MFKRPEKSDAMQNSLQDGYSQFFRILSHLESNYSRSTSESGRPTDRNVVLCVCILKKTNLTRSMQ